MYWEFNYKIEDLNIFILIIFSDEWWVLFVHFACLYRAISYDLWSQVASVSATCIGDFTSYRFDFSQKITKHQSC